MPFQAPFHGLPANDCILTSTVQSIMMSSCARLLPWMPTSLIGFSA